MSKRLNRRHERNVLFFLFLIVLFLASIAHSTYYMRQYELERRLAEFEERDVQRERNRLLQEQNELIIKMLVDSDIIETFLSAANADKSQQTDGKE